MTTIEIIQLVIGSGGALGIAFLVFRSGRTVEKIDNLGRYITKLEDSLKSEIREVRADLKELRVDVADVKERVSFMESFVFFSEIQAESNNPRSDAAKKMWERRKMKKLESRGK